MEAGMCNLSMASCVNMISSALWRALKLRLATRILLILAILMPGLAHCQSTGDPASSWESLHERLTVRQDLWQRANEAEAANPIYSEFKGQYLRPEHAQLYRSFVKLNSKTGLLESDGRIIRPFFTIYVQPKAGGDWIINIQDFDFDLLEKDFARMKQAGINVQPRFWNWSELLNYDGSWRVVEKQPKGTNLPWFKYVYEVYDYFLDRAQVHGLYVNIEPSFFWGLDPGVIPQEYRGKILVYDDLWNAATQAYAKILGYYSRRTCIIAAMVGEEDLAFDDCVSDPWMQDQFRRFLKKKYGSISNLKRTWGYGYDYSDHSLWAKRTIDGKDVIWPEYPFAKGVFDKWNSFDDAQTPILDRCRSVDDPGKLIGNAPTYQQNVTKDPAWIDYMEAKEQILISRLNYLADTLRAVDPNHILHYSNPYDFCPAWQFLHCFNRGQLRWDVIGVGQHDSGFEPSEVPHWASCREYIQNVASYGPYIGATGVYPKGFACGEGEGGKTRDGVAKYYPWWLTDIVGGGGAFFLSYNWNHISGRTLENPTGYDEASLNKLGEFLAAVRDVPFSNKGDARVLILRSQNAAYSMSAGYDIGNSRYLGSILYQLHVPFDILPDSDITPGDFEPGKININKYRFIFVPEQNQLLSARTWQMLQDWVTDPRSAGRRGLCLGLYQDQDSYFNPTQPSAVHPAFERLTGLRGFDKRVPASGPTKFRYAKLFGRAIRGDELSLVFPENGEIGCISSVPANADRILDLGEGGPAVVVRNIVNGNSVYICGFYLGLSYWAVDGKEKQQEPYDLLTPLYGSMMASAGVETPVKAPDNLGVYLSDDASTILVKERFGKETEVKLEFKALPGSVFAGTTTILNADGGGTVKDFRIGPYDTLVLKKAAGFNVSGMKAGSSVCKATPEGGIEATVTGKGKFAVTFVLKPKTIYSVRENGELTLVFTAPESGKQRVAFNLGAGQKPLRISVKPNKR